jgi:hypothetical protein
MYSLYILSTTGFCTRSSLVCCRFIDVNASLLRLFERVSRRIILPQHNLLLFLRRDVFDPYLLGHVLCEVPNKSRIPKLRRNPQIFTAAHERIRLASLSRGRDPIRVKVLLLSASNGY